MNGILFPTGTGGGGSGGNSRSFDLYDCDAGAAVGDTVFYSDTDDNKVVVNSDNKEDYLTVGIIINKPSSTTCIVQHFGKCDITFSGLERGKAVALSAGGSLTTGKPSGGYIQVIGFCYEADKIFINPATHRIKQDPF